MGLLSDVFVLMQPGDSTQVTECVQSILANLADRGRVCVVASDLQGEIHQQLQDLGCIFLKSAEVFGFDAAAIPGDAKARESFLAQLLRWELRKFSSTPTYLVVDVNCRLTRPTALWCGDQPVLFCENRFRFGHLMCFNYFFGQIPYPASPATSELQHLDCRVVEEMVAKIQARWKMPWAQAAFAILQQVPGTAFDAGQNYGHYLGIFRPGSFAVEPYQSKTSNPTPAEPSVVRMATLGHNGRFANQLFQFAYLQAYARREGLQAECPPWIGCSLFGHKSELGQESLPIYREDKGETDEMIRFDPDQHLKNLELWGYFQDPKHWAGDPRAFQEMFKPLPFLKKPLDEAIARLRGTGGTLVAIHLRRGDFTGGPTFWPTPEAWYLRWLNQIWPMLVNPVLYIASDDAKNVLPQFAAYQPRSAADLNITVNGAEYYSDFYMLSQCDVLGISNSSFSFAAAMMNTKAAAMVRPDPVLEKMAAFDPWTSPVQLRRPNSIPQSRAA